LFLEPRAGERQRVGDHPADFGVFTQQASFHAGAVMLDGRR